MRRRDRIVYVLNLKMIFSDSYLISTEKNSDSYVSKNGETGDKIKNDKFLGGD